MKDPLIRQKLTMSAFALSVLAVRMVWPSLQIDMVSIGLIVLVILPWLSTLIKSAELPGGVKIEFQDFKTAIDKVADVEPTGARLSTAAAEKAFQSSAELDPALALVSLRIEIEQRLRKLAKKVGIIPRGSLIQVTRQLHERGVVNEKSIGGLLELVDLGNQAAHGVSVSQDVANSAVEYGPRILGMLDKKLLE
ncbi:MAG: hypothetical protein HYZ01_12695 [Ignavibacteriales bacterium]|nr:hypothetical protein [Ignavibacteriales bacterium]